MHFKSFYFIIFFSFSLVSAQQTLTDKEINEAVELQLLISEETSSHLVDSETVNGIVTLSGTVDHILARDKAVEIAKSVKGVRSVINRMTVKPPKKSDTQILRDVQEALRMDPVTESYELLVKVKNGTVTLEGNVQSWSEKQIAEQVAKGISGVRDIENNIEINYEFDRNDFEIKSEVERHLKADVWLDDDYIDVEVRNGTVYLSGSVASAREISRAIEDAWVIGVNKVHTDSLNIDFSPLNRLQKQDQEKLPHSSALERAIRDAFFWDPRVKSLNPTVIVENGVATLRGTVSNLKAKLAAGSDAKNTYGIWRVKNFLQVRPETQPEDEKIKKNVIKVLDRDPYLGRYDLEVDVVNGRVILSGTVDWFFEKARARDVIAGLAGVISVDNNIISSAEWVWKSDRAIRSDINEEFFWNPELDNAMIDVKVDDGVVTLAGFVNSLQTMREAEKEAYQGGARKVKNELKIRDWPYYYLPH